MSDGEVVFSLVFADVSPSGSNCNVAEDVHRNGIWERSGTHSSTKGGRAAEILHVENTCVKPSPPLSTPAFEHMQKEQNHAKSLHNKLDA